MEENDVSIDKGWVFTNGALRICNNMKEDEKQTGRMREEDDIATTKLSTQYVTRRLLLCFYSIGVASTETLFSKLSTSVQ